MLEFNSDEETPFACHYDNCDKKYKYPDKAIEHATKKHKVTKAAAEEYKKQFKNRVRHVCAQKHCGESFSRTNHLKQHLKKDHGIDDEYELDAEMEGTYQCRTAAATTSHLPGNLGAKSVRFSCLSQSEGLSSHDLSSATAPSQLRNVQLFKTGINPLV